MSDVPHPDPTGTGPQDGVSPADGTLRGYLGLHHRPPAFDGSDGYPYTVSSEVVKTPNLHAPFSGYLIFPRWAKTGAGIVGHLETPILLRGTSREEIMAALGALTLHDISDHLREAILRRQEETE